MNISHSDYNKTKNEPLWIWPYNQRIFVSFFEIKHLKKKTYHDLYCSNNVCKVLYAEPYFCSQSNSVLINLVNPVAVCLLRRWLMFSIQTMWSRMAFYRYLMHRSDNECKRMNRHVRAERWLGYQNQIYYFQSEIKRERKKMHQNNFLFRFQRVN